MLTKLYASLSHRVVAWVGQKRFPVDLSLFDEIRANLRRGKEVFEALPAVEEDLVMGPWKQRVREMTEDVLCSDRPHLLSHESLRYAMIVGAGGTSMRRELRYLESRLSEQALRALLVEPRVEGLPVNSLRYKCSHNNIHLLHHLVFFEEHSRSKIVDCDRIVEFGGGYGNLARLAKQMAPEATLILIDLPIFLLIQFAYLESVLGRGTCCFVTSENEPIQKGKINLLNAQSTYSISQKCDLFVSTVALSECTQAAQHAVIEASFFQADHLLLTHQPASVRWKNAESLIQPIDREFEIYLHGKAPTAGKDERYILARRRVS